MHFGLYSLNTYAASDGDGRELYRRLLEQIDAAEALGFDSYWCTEHHFQPFGGMVPNPQLVLAAAAARTRRLRLGTAVTLLALHDPPRIAEDFAVLDCLSDGRVELGAGRGMFQEDYTVFGRNWENAQERLKEALHVVERAWTTESLDWEGEHYAYGSVNVLPKPVQHPRPRIWFTANRDPESFRWAGEQGYHLMTLPWLFPLEDSIERIEIYRQAWAASGHGESPRLFVMYPVHVADTAEQARAQAGPAWQVWRAYTHAKEPIFTDAQRALSKRMDDYNFVTGDRRCVFGDAEQCANILQPILDALRPTDVALSFHFGGLSQPAVLRSMELFMTAVKPRLHLPEGANRAPAQLPARSV